MARLSTLEEFGVELVDDPQLREIAADVGETRERREIVDDRVVDDPEICRECEVRSASIGELCPRCHRDNFDGVAS